MDLKRPSPDLTSTLNFINCRLQRTTDSDEGSVPAGSGSLQAALAGDQVLLFQGFQRLAHRALRQRSLFCQMALARPTGAFGIRPGTRSGRLDRKTTFLLFRPSTRQPAPKPAREHFIEFACEQSTHCIRAHTIREVSFSQPSATSAPGGRSNAKGAMAKLTLVTAVWSSSPWR